MDRLNEVNVEKLTSVRAQMFAIENVATFQLWVQPEHGGAGRFSSYADEATVFASHTQAQRQLVVCQRFFPQLRLRVRSLQRADALGLGRELVG